MARRLPGQCHGGPGGHARPTSTGKIVGRLRAGESDAEAAKGTAAPLPGPAGIAALAATRAIYGTASAQLPVQVQASVFNHVRQVTAASTCGL